MPFDLHWHPDIFLHDAHAGHVAMARDRIQCVYEGLAGEPGAQSHSARPASWEELCLVHDEAHLQKLQKAAYLADEAFLRFDRETILNRHTWRALVLSAGAVCGAVDRAVAGTAAKNAFCAGYAGHHAEPAHAAGFCFTNPVAIGAKHALTRGVERVAVLDIDTHSGNGTILALLNEPRVLFAETYQKGYPGSFLPGFRPAHILRERCDQAWAFAPAWEKLLAAVRAFQPELILVSAGFDAHKADPLGLPGLSDTHYLRLGEHIARIGAPVIATLEGGYSVPDTVSSARNFVRGLRAA